MIWSEMCAMVRWLARRPAPRPATDPGPAIQAAEAEAARQRILNQARQ